MKPINNKIQNYYTQTGVLADALFMWKYDAGEHYQSAYQIDVYEKDKIIFSTNKIVSGEQNNIDLPLDLAEQMEYEFTVTVWDENDISETSDSSKFITGVKNWRGEWIGNGTAKPFVARKNFTADAGEKSILSICVPGQFEVRINGERISPYVYEGSQTDFNRHVHYSTYDITTFIHNGENEITVEVANGWYIGDNDNGKRYFYTADKGYIPFGDCLSVMVQLKIGERYIITDNTWEVSRSQTVLADIYGSEDIDHTVEYTWSKARTVTPPKGEIIPVTYPPVIRKYTYDPQHIDKKRMIFDFGQNMSSLFHLKIKGKRGQKIKLIPAEKLLEDGDICQTVDTYSILTLSGGEDLFEQKFSVNGARWYKIEGAEYEQIIAFKSYFATSSANDSGYFRCSDERINSIHTLILKAIESNINHSHTDCPTIEKLGWLEPDHLMARSIMYNRDIDTLWSKIAMDMRDSQYTDGESDVDNGSFPHEYKSGLIPSIAPRYAKFITDWQHSGSFWDIIPWGSSIILAAYEQYRFYGNRQILADNYDSAKKYIEYLTEQYHDYNRLYNKNSSERFICAGLGDWGIIQNGGNSRENIETAFYYHDLVTMAKISKILVKNDEAAFWAQAENVKALYNDSLLIADDGVAYYRSYDDGSVTQANQAIPLCFGLVPQTHYEAVEKTLIGLCENDHLRCGEIGLVYILRALSSAGRNDIIYNMILKDTHPSYLRFVQMGETTLPEFWRDDARSRNHDMMGHIMEWFFSEIAGIKSEDGFKTVRVNPACTAFIDGFECELDSVRGKIKVLHDGSGLSVTVPNNVSCVFCPDICLPSGSYFPS